MRDVKSVIKSVVIFFVLLLSMPVVPVYGFEKESERLFEAVDNEQIVLKILSNTDLDYFEPLILSYQQQYPATTVFYTVASSVELYQAINDESADYDVVISSAMDLQMKLVNDGLAQKHQSSVVDALPDWSKWGNSLFAFTQEPAVLLASKKALGEIPVPQNRNELITLLRDHPERFAGRVGTYDIRSSGAGYLFATQDSRQSDSFWRLAEVIGSTSPRLYCCSSDMIAALRRGDIVFAYNVVGSYASAALSGSEDGVIVPLKDYQIFMLRTALIPKTSARASLAGTFIDFLADADNRGLIGEQAGLPPVDGQALKKHQHFRPIALGPGLLVFLDKIKRQHFVRAWTDAMLQP